MESCRVIAETRDIVAFCIVVTALRNNNILRDIGGSPRISVGRALHNMSDLVDRKPSGSGRGCECKRGSLVSLSGGSVVAPIVRRLDCFYSLFPLTVRILTRPVRRRVFLIAPRGRMTAIDVVSRWRRPPLATISIVIFLLLLGSRLRSV